jgi:threonine/homoserine efflux transporter RhtA|tara:strand:+ start:1656 stop:1892 length:237 start_codon:yes stop_codon:yes gene_type:complete
MNKKAVLLTAFWVIYLLASFASCKHLQNRAQSENRIAGIFTFCPFAIDSATDSIVAIDMIFLRKLILLVGDEHELLGG